MGHKTFSKPWCLRRGGRGTGGPRQYLLMDYMQRRSKTIHQDLT
jgi:hypothetical protein